MYLLNLSFLQFLGVFGGISAFAVALYLLDRSRHRQVVSTLRFWVAAEQPAAAAHRRHIQQPWSLVLQLLSMALLLLAIAQLRWGAPVEAGRDHVLVLDTSAWMAARSGNRTLMDLARDRARQYVRALPARDRVMLVRADALATPATAFEPDRRKLETAILASQPGSTALNLDQALGFARHIQSQAGGRAGEIAFVGTSRTSEREAAAPPPPRNLRVLLVADPIENCGLRKIGMRRSSADPGLWEIYVSAHNYGTQPRTVNLAIDFGPGGSAGRVAAGTQRITLPAGAEKEASFEYRTDAAGILGVTLTPHDAFPGDDRAELELPAQPTLQVTVYSAEPDLLKPLLAATPRVTAVYRKPSEYRATDTGLVILDRFAPPQRPTADSLWIDPPAGCVAHSGAPRGGAGGLRRLGQRSSRRRRPAHEGFQAGAHHRFRAGARRRPHRRSGSRTSDCRARRPSQDRGLRFSSNALRHALRAGHTATVRQPAALVFAGDLSAAGRSPAAASAR